jgi:hypothetical protein
MIVVIADVDEVAALLDMDEPRAPEIILPQTSGPCVHYGPYGCEVPREDGQCPHLDDDVICPVKDACYAMSEVARMREACEAEQGHRDADMAAGEAVYETETPEFVEPAPDEILVYEIVIPPQSKRKDGWSEDEMWVIARTDTLAEAVEAYRFRFPDSTRTDQAITSQWRKLRSQPPRIRKPPQMADVAPSQTYETAAPEFVEPEPDDGALHTYTVPATRKPTNPNAWSDEEIEVIRRAQSADEASRLYSETYGIWKRSRSAVTSRWYKLRAAGELIAPAPTPDFVGDTAPVTQCDEDPVFAVPRPAYRPGDRVRIKHALHRGHTGEIVRYFPATENYLVAIDGLPDRIILRDKDLEVGA